MSMLRFDQVQAGYEPNRPILKNLSFELKEGEILGLLGNSGSGKSTLARLLCGEIKAQAGHIYFDDEEVTMHLNQRKWRQKLRVSMVYQDPNSSLHPKKTLIQQFKECLIASGQREAAADEEKLDALQKSLGLDPSLSSRYPQTLSGGQKQRAAIACAMLVQPRLLIADEAVSALDLSVQAQILNYFRFLRESHQFSCLFISHDIDVLAYLCDRLMVLENGEIVEIKDTESLMKNPSSKAAQRLLKDALSRSPFEDGAATRSLGFAEN